ncbi:lipoprotein [Pseudoxanthomonas mexicana]
MTIGLAGCGRKGPCRSSATNRNSSSEGLAPLSEMLPNRYQWPW